MHQNIHKLSTVCFSNIICFSISLRIKANNKNSVNVTSRLVSLPKIPQDLPKQLFSSMLDRNLKLTR